MISTRKRGRLRLGIATGWLVSSRCKTQTLIISHPSPSLSACTMLFLSPGLCLSSLPHRWYLSWPLCPWYHLGPATAHSLPLPCLQAHNQFPGDMELPEPSLPLYPSCPGQEGG